MTVERKYARVPEWCMGIVTNNCWDGITETERAQWNVFQVEIKTKFGESATIRLTLEEDNEIELFFFPENHVDDLAGNCCTVDILHNGLKEFTILVEQKVKCWQYITFEITAKNEEEAKAMAIEIYNNGNTFDYNAEYEIADDYQEMTPVENYGGATVAISFDGGRDHFYTNVDQFYSGPRRIETDENHPTHSLGDQKQVEHQGNNPPVNQVAGELFREQD